MKTILKAILGIAGTLFVGKVCYEIGKDVGAVEQQLKQPEPEEKPVPDDVEYCVDSYDGEPKAEGKPEEKPEKPERTSFMDKIRGLRTLKDVKDLLTRKDSSVLGDILKNPDGTEIHASVSDGEIRINVKPKKRE